MKIKGKLIAGISAITVVTIILGVTAFINSSNVAEHFEFLVEHDLKVLQNAEKLQKQIVDAETGQRGFIITGDETFLEPYNSGLAGFTQIIEELKELVSDNPPQVEKLEKIEELFYEWRINAAEPEIALARQVHQSTNENYDINDLSDLLRAKTGKVILDNIRLEFAEFIKIEEKLKDERFAISIAIGNSTRNNVIILTSINIAIGILIIIFLLRVINNPLIKLTNASRQIAKADFDVNIVVKGDDELNELAKSFNKMAKDLQQIDKQKEEFLSMVSHELKTPLVPIGLYAEMLLKSDKLGTLTEKQRKAISTIYKNMKALQLLVGDVLDVNKIDLQKMKLKKEEFDIKELLDELKTNLEAYTKEKNISLQIECDETWKIFADSKRIAQVISNLVKNSVDFTPENGSIIVRAEKGGNKETVFTVQDTGSGITQDEIDKLFKKFYQIDSSAKRKHGGTGLGLAICRGLVEAHGGEIWYDKKYSKGASFKFTIPCV